MLMNCHGFLKHIALLFITFGITVGYIPFCPNEFMKEWTESAEVLQISIGHILNNPNISLSNQETYKFLTDDFGMSVTPEGFDHFQEATSKIIAAKLVACSDPKERAASIDDISKLISKFTRHLDAKDMNQVYSIYGKLLCLLELSLKTDAAKIKRELSNASDPLEIFFDSLNATQVKTMFGYIGYKPTLAFVVDDTGSMWEEIESVKKVIKSFIKTERTDTHAYILTTFNDPEVGVAQKYAADNVTSLNALIQAVDKLEPHEGGDCSELGMTGILNALNLANEESNVVVLTDASPKDIEKKDEVIARAISLYNSIHFFLSRECGDVEPYIDVAKKTYGIVINHIKDFEAFVDFANNVSHFKTASLLHNSDESLPHDSDESIRTGKKRQASRFENYCANVTASVFTKSIDIFFSSINSGSVITVINPIGKVDRIISPNGNTDTYSTNPIPGTYKICSNKVMNVSVSNPSDLDFCVTYVDVNISSSSLPSPGTSIKVLIISSRISDISLSKRMSLNLLSKNNIISSNTIVQCGSALAGIIVIPNVPFQYQLVGYDILGNYFSKTKKTVLISQVKAKMCNSFTSTHSHVHGDTISTFFPTSTSKIPISNGSNTTSTFTFPTSTSEIRISHSKAASIFILPTSTSGIAKYMHTSTIATSTSLTTSVITSITNSPKASVHCPCQNGGRCILIVRFGRRRVQCRCPEDYTGSLCQYKLPFKYRTT